MSTSAAWTWQNGSTSGLLGNDLEHLAGINAFYFLIWLVLYPFECQYFLLGHYLRILMLALLRASNSLPDISTMPQSFNFRLSTNLGLAETIMLIADLVYTFPAITMGYIYGTDITWLS